MRSPKSRTSKPMHIQSRKDARTAIYKAVFGEQDWTHDDPRSRGPRLNKPWLDTSRHRPQDWSTQSAWGTFEALKADAQLSREALIEIASVLKVDLSEVL